MSIPHMLCLASRCAAAALAGGFLLASVLAASAQSQPPDQAQGEQKPQDKAQGEQKPADEAAAEQQAAARAVAEYQEAAAKLPHSAGSADCVWTGRRIASLLWRDDIDTARKYIELYDRFGCSADHLKQAFRCVVQQGPIDPKAADRLASRVHSCWVAPEEPITASSQTTTSPAPKGGSVPN